MVWDDRSPMQALPRMGSANRVAQHPAASFLPFDTLQSNEFGAGIQPPLPRNGSHAAYHTAQEIEEEMRLAALRQREAQARELQAREQQQLQEHYERLRLQELQAMQRAELDYQQQSRTPPPRMHPHSQSPRFHHQLQQHILVQQQREQAREQHAFHSISAQLRAEELARRERELGVQASPQARLLAEQQLATQTQRLGSPGQLDPRLAVELQQLRRASPAFDPHIQQLHSVGTGAAPRGTQILPDDIQMQQIMLRRNANDEFLREMVGSEQVGRRIMEAERMEEQRRRKAAKISHMVGLFLTFTALLLTVNINSLVTMTS